MTTYSIVVSGATGTADITARTLHASLDRSLGEASATMELRCRDILLNHTMETITVTVDGVVRFQGTVKSQTDTKTGGVQKITQLKCVDNTDKLQRRLYAGVFENQTAKQMIVSMLTELAPWVSTSGVNDVGGAIESLKLEYDTAADAIQKIADLVGAYWYLDENDVLHFFENYDSTVSVGYDAGTNILKDSFNIESTAVELCNRVWVIGAKSASTSYTEQYWTGDGNNSVFTLAYEPNYPEVYEDGVQKTIEVDKGSGISEKDYAYDKKNKVLKRTAGALTSGVQLRFKYKPTVQVIDYFEDPGSVATYGLYEKAVRDKKITDKAAARKRGRAALKRSKSVIKKLTWNTRDWGVAPGQLVNVTVDSFSYAGTARINSISVEFTPDDIVASIDAEEVVT